MKKNSNRKQNSSKKQNRAGTDAQNNPETFAFYIGMDLGDKHCDVCVLGPDGKLNKQFRLAMKRADVLQYFGSVGHSRVALEAGGQSRWVAEAIEACGHQVYVANARKVGYITQADDKDDPGDAYKLAELVHFKPQLLHPIRHRSREAQADLSWIRGRAALVESRTQLINTVRGMSKGFGERLQRCAAEGFTGKMAEHLPAEIRGAVAPLLEVLDHLNEQIDYYDQRIEHLARERYAHHTQLTQVRGVGVQTALTYLLTIEDPERFAKSRQVGPFLGMRPRKQDSGASQPQLGITKAGDMYLRKTLVNCAHYMLGPFGEDSDLRRFGLRICARGGKNAKKRAVIAVARKLGVLLHRLWVSGEAYEPLRNSQQPKVA
jgi:transposase